MSSLMKQQNTAATVQVYLSKNRDVLIRTLPDGFNFDRMCRAAINAISTTPQLRGCTPSSLFLSIVRAFSLGLEPNGGLEEGYLIPYKDQAKFMPSYRGLITLARRSGTVEYIYAAAVHQKDEFRVELGTEKKVIHLPDYFGDRGAVVGFYAVVSYNGGGSDFEVMSMAEIEKVKRSSRSSKDGPWVEWPDEMAKKTVIKRLLKRVPMSIELAKAVNTDNAAIADSDRDDILDIQGLEVPQESSRFEPAKQERPTTEEKHSAAEEELL